MHHYSKMEEMDPFARDGLINCNLKLVLYVQKCCKTLIYKDLCKNIELENFNKINY